MSHRPALILLILTITAILALPVSAQQSPLTQDQVQGLVRDGFGDWLGAKTIEKHGIDFAPTEDFIQSLKMAGANEVFLGALQAAQRTRKTEVTQHIARGAAFMRDKWYSDAENEFREAIRLGPNDGYAYSKVGEALWAKGDLDAAIAMFRGALRLNPKNDMAHAMLGDVLATKGNPFPRGNGCRLRGLINHRHQG